MEKIELQEYTKTKEQYEKLQLQIENSHNGLVDGVRYFRPTITEDGSYHYIGFDLSKKLKNNTKTDEELYNQINDELKALYVAITRAK